jgi:hypothetical protein
MSISTLILGCAAFILYLYYFLFKRKRIKEWPYENKVFFYGGLVFLLFVFLIEFFRALANMN